MARKRNIAKGRSESGPFVMLPKSVINSPVYFQLPPRAVKLLVDMLSCYNGRNNGDFCITWSLMEKRGWKSRETLNDARKDLINTGFILVSRQGGRNLSSLYAITFMAIDECKGKHNLTSTAAAPNNWKKT